LSDQQIIANIQRELSELLDFCRDRKKAAEADIIVLGEVIEDLNDGLIATNLKNPNALMSSLKNATAKIKSIQVVRTQ